MRAKDVMSKDVITVGPSTGIREIYAIFKKTRYGGLPVAVLYFIVSEKVDKVMAVFTRALLMIISGLIFGFYSQAKALKAIDFNTLGLLLGIMIIVSILKRTVFFT